jgi:putative ABC transport system permease protein
MTRQWRVTFRDVWLNIRSQPGRTGLSVLAIAIGISSLTVLISLLNGLQEKSRHMKQELGANVVAIVQQGLDPKARALVLAEKHVDYLRLNLPACRFSGIRRYSVSSAHTDEDLTVLATDHELRNVRQWRMHTGRFLDEGDVRMRQRNAVISRELARRLSLGVHDIIMVGQIPYKIVGAVDIGGSALDAELGDSSLVLGERVVFVPCSVSPDWLSEGRKPGSTLDVVFVQSPDSQDCARSVTVAKRLLSQPDCKLDHVSWVTPESLTRNIRRLQRTIRLTVGSISVLCLILGGTTLMSLMVANVRERITEIGLRRALGATRRDIAVLFVGEACIVTLCAGLAGTVATHLSLALSRSVLSVPIRMNWASSALPLVVAVVLGVGFACWPAWSAANISPSEALRNE